MKKNLFSALFALLILSEGNAFASDFSLVTRLETSYRAKFYPGVVRYAEEILKSEPASFTALKAGVYEGESLFMMGRIDEAQKILTHTQIKADDSESNFLKAAKFYWLGRCYFSKKDYDSAQSCFYSAARFAGNVKNKKNEKLKVNRTDYFSQAILWGGRTYINSKNEESAIPLLEYIVSNGEKFSKQDFDECAVNLAICCNDCLLFDKTEKLILQFEPYFEKEIFSPSIKYSLILLQGDALAGLRQYKKAYELFCRVLAEAPSYLAASAMKKAYYVSADHKSEVGQEPGAVLAKAEKRLFEYPELLGEFWTRLAIDAFNAGELKKASDYFGEAEKSASELQLQIASVYLAEIAYVKGGKGIKGSDSAIKILLDVLKKTHVERESEIFYSINLNLARFYGYRKNWAECERYAYECFSSKSEDVLKNAYYWAALCKYENGYFTDASLLLEKYLNDVSGGKKLASITADDTSILNLYAKSLAQDGNYSKADEIFYALGKKNQLDSKGHLDYSRTLLQGGYYVSTKEEAALAGGDEALYLSALASFNQRRWSEAENLFGKIISSRTLKSEHVAFALFYLGYSQYQLEEYENAISTLNSFVVQNPDHKFLWSAYMTSARSSALCRNYSKAVADVLSAVKKSKSESEKHESILLCAGIYSDSEKYDEALSLLEPYVSKKDSFGYECKFRSAEILARKKDFDKADRYFADLVDSGSRKNAHIFAEDSAYRRGEIQYSNAQYEKAKMFFEDYCKKWPKGKFFYAAIYFSADCLVKTGAEDRAVLRYLQLADSDADTAYRYASQKKLVDLYESSGEIKLAYEMARRIFDEYGEQAVNDGINEKLEALSIKLKNGGKKKDNFIAGEKPVDAKTAIQLASYYRSSGENKMAADTYIEAAFLARKNGDSDSAERALYGAVEAFDAAGLYGDSKATFDEMKKLYPDSKYTKEAKKLVQ